MVTLKDVLKNIKLSETTILSCVEENTFKDEYYYLEKVYKYLTTARKDLKQILLIHPGK